MGRAERRGTANILRELGTNPVIPAVRGPDEELDAALMGDHAAIFVLGGDVYKLVEKLEGWSDRPPVCVNVDLVGGVTGDSAGISYLSRHVEGIISTNRQVIEHGNTAGMVTVQRLFALDLGTIERGLKLVKRAKPGFVEVLPALTYPLMASRHPEVLDWSVLAGGLLKSRQEISRVLDAGAAGVSTSARELWKKP